MGYWNGFPPYVSVAERKAKALKQFEKLNRKNDFEPVRITGRKIASSWWGKSWNDNLERYADYANRIERGRSYVRNGMVLDLRIREREISALVAGSRSRPYKVSIAIDGIPGETWESIVCRSSERIDSMASLMEGSFPRELKDIFFCARTGLFPAPSEIKFSCSCPDWAAMCKHVAAALYGIGARFDAAPELFFLLRGMSMDELIGTVAQKETERLLDRQGKGSRRILKQNVENDDLEALFGISMVGGESESASEPVPGRKTLGENTSATKKAATKKATAKKATAKKATAKKATAKKATAKKATAKKATAKKAATKKTTAKKTTAKKTTAKKATAKKATAKKATAKKAATKKTTAKKTTAKKATAKKATAKKATAKKATAKKAATKKTTTKKKVARLAPQSSGNRIGKKG